MALWGFSEWLGLKSEMQIPPLCCGMTTKEGLERWVRSRQGCGLTNIYELRWSRMLVQTELMGWRR